MQGQQEELLAARTSMEAVLDSAEATGNELAAETVRSFGSLRIRATGSSMLPSIRPGDVLQIRRCRPVEAGRGDVVLFIRHSRLFAHRVVARVGAGLVTQGDALAAPDPSVRASELLGKVTHVLRRGKPIRSRSGLTISGRLTAALLRRSAIAGRLLTRLHGLQDRVGL